MVIESNTHVNGRKLIESFSDKKRALIVRQINRNRVEIIGKWHSEFENIFDLNQEGIEQISSSGTKERLEVKLEFLRQYICTGQNEFCYVYLDEWYSLAHLKGDANNALINKFFRRIASHLIQALDISTVEKEIFEQSLQFLHAHLVREPTSSDIRILALGDCLIGTIRRFLPHLALERGIGLQLRHMYISATEGKDISADKVVKEIIEYQPDIMAISFLSYRALPQYNLLFEIADEISNQEIKGHTDALVGTIRRYLDDLRIHTEAPIILHNASGLPLTKWRNRNLFMSPHSTAQKNVLNKLNEGIREIVLNQTNTLLLDEFSLAASIGHRRAWKGLIPRSLARKAHLHIESFGVQLTEPYLDILHSYAVLRKVKLILVDFDNTLWKGVMADGPVEQDIEIQSIFLKLQESGIVLAAVSKNDPANIRWDEILLKQTDFVRLKISWNLKVQSIEEIAHELELGLDSFLLIDDSPEERALVTHTLPQVAVLDPTESSTRAALERLLSFPNTRQTDEAKRRTEMYRAQAERKEALRKDYDYPSMMASLKLTVRFGIAKEGDLARIEELVQRTNQFNTTTRRYTRSQIQAFLATDSHTIFVAELEDRFSSLGLVAIAIVEHTNSAGVIDSFIMSCRAMGFGLENAMLRLVVDEIATEQVIGEYIPTDRNSPAKNLYSDANFDPLDNDKWALDFRHHTLDMPSWITIHRR